MKVLYLADVLYMVNQTEEYFYKKRQEFLNSSGDRQEAFLEELEFIQLERRIQDPSKFIMIRRNEGA